MTAKRTHSSGLVSLILAIIVAMVMVPADSQEVKAYSKLCDAHPYIVQKASDLYSNEEIDDYIEYIKDGSLDEDDTDHVYGYWDLVHIVLPHFWDADNGPDDPVESFGKEWENTWQKAQVLWGMAVGEYYADNTSTAYEYLGHVAHLLADMSVPAHVHEDMHPPTHDDDCYEDWMSSNYELVIGGGDVAYIHAKGPLEIPDDVDDPLFYLFYTMNQIADFFASDDEDGDTDDFYGGWMNDIYTELDMYSVTSPITSEDLTDNNDFEDRDGDGDLSRIRHYSYLNAIRATAALYKLFDETTSKHSELTVVIKGVEQNEDSSIHDADDPDYYVEVSIDDFQFLNRGDHTDDAVSITPGWAFARDIGVSGNVSVVIKLWDWDGTNDRDGDDQSDIDPADDKEALNLIVNLENGDILGDVEGECGVVLTSSGNEGKMSTLTFVIRLPNRPPTAEAGGPYTAYEGVPVTLDASDSSDPDNNIASYKWDLNDDGEYDDATGVSPSITFGDNGIYPIGLRVTDDYGESSTATSEVNVYNVVPAARANPTSQTVQYSDKIAVVGIVAEDVEADTMTAFTWWSDDGVAFVSGLPDGLVLNHEGCSVADGIRTCSWALDGTANVHAGVYTVHVIVKDEDGSQFPILTITINVLSEDATIVFDSSNKEAVQVEIPGDDSGSFSLSVQVNEASPDLPVGMGEPGDISLADVKMRLVPVGPGLAVVPTSWTKAVNGTEYDAVLNFTCNFDDVPVNTYTVEVVVGGGYHTAYAEDMLVVYDPKHAFTTGQGWFYWPETSEKEKTDFEFSIEYKKKDEPVQGSLLLIRRLPNGSSYRIQSKRLYGLALGESPARAFGWASFSGKASYIEPDWSDPIGDYEFVVYVEDHKPSTGLDQFWIEVHDSDGNAVDVMSMDREATDNTIEIDVGNIVVPPKKLKP